MNHVSAQVRPKHPLNGVFGQDLAGWSLSRSIFNKKKCLRVQDGAPHGGFEYKHFGRTFTPHIATNFIKPLTKSFAGFFNPASSFKIRIH